ncbi:inorganic phosphate transporter [Clostridium lacusfryxellense]|uniref:inorganic phosphate transporter n=1 Tax=Clostridium lacusfryxellense TaxID=205328 RepID=UPI001C0B25E2|nr:inorganic phosphate transporter [Clostridium lacusfryxellense]
MAYSHGSIDAQKSMGVITSAIMGVGSCKRLSAVRWSLARTILVAWVLTIPCSAIIASLISLVFL